MIQIFSTSNCPRCLVLKEAFQKAGVGYEEGILDAEIVAECLCDTGEHITTAPLVKDGHVWKFYDDFFDKSGNLLPDWLKNMKGIKPRKEGFAGEGGKSSSKMMDCKLIWK